MKAITLWQPWASLIAIGAKPYEFRGWNPPRSMIGQRIAIHAGARAVRIEEVLDLLRRLRIDADDEEVAPCLHARLAVPFLNRVRDDLRARDTPLLGAALPFRLPLSSIVCTAVLGTPRRGDECARELGGGNDSDRMFQFNWGWPMLQIEPLVPPVPARGAQGFWNWSAP